mmetsp:Transcript_54648/g.168293  ORF Transcript_54648/g.168293 Transcript_54648/m.168293 type:complete len:319 (+) Transcript_54648:925-1881(+)
MQGGREGETEPERHERAGRADCGVVRGGGVQHDAGAEHAGLRERRLPDARAAARAARRAADGRDARVRAAAGDARLRGGSREGGRVGGRGEPPARLCSQPPARGGDGAGQVGAVRGGGGGGGDAGHSVRRRVLQPAAVAARPRGGAGVRHEQRAGVLPGRRRAAVPDVHRAGVRAGGGAARAGETGAGGQVPGRHAGAHAAGSRRRHAGGAAQAARADRRSGRVLRDRGEGLHGGRGARLRRRACGIRGAVPRAGEQRRIDQRRSARGARAAAARSADRRDAGRPGGRVRSASCDEAVRGGRAGVQRGAGRHARARGA